MAKDKIILPTEVADRFTVDPKAPVRFVHRLYGEYDLRTITVKTAEFLAQKGLYLKAKKQQSKDPS